MLPAFTGQTSKVDALRTAQEQMAALLARSAVDMVFRHKLLRDPRGTIAEFTGHDLPPSFNVVFVENQADTTIVLPDPIVEDELSGEWLKHVAGGAGVQAPVEAGVLVLHLPGPSSLA